MKSKNLVLIGMPGAGKSTTGVLIAKELGLSFVDVDLVIQEKEEALLQQIIDRVGLEEFLKIEERAVLGLNLEGYVIATGGSVIYSKAAIDHLKKMGPLVYLKVSFEEIARRIDNIASRGIVFGDGKGLSDIYEERKVLYEKNADIVIDSTALDIEEVEQEVVKAVQNWPGRA